MEKRIVRRGLIGLALVGGGLFGPAEGAEGAGELAVHERDGGVAAEGGAPDGGGFFFAPEEPERFAFFLVGEDQIIPLGERLIEAAFRFFEAAEPI